MSTERIRLTKDELSLVVNAIECKFVRSGYRLGTALNIAIHEVNARRREREDEMRSIGSSISTASGRPVAGPFSKPVTDDAVGSAHNDRVEALRLALKRDSSDILADAEAFYEFISRRP